MGCLLSQWVRYEDGLCPSQEYSKSIASGCWCILVYFCTNLGFNVEGLNIEVHGGRSPLLSPLLLPLIGGE